MEPEQTTKLAITFACKVLRFFGLGYVVAEDFRRAKHDDEHVMPLLWTLLADLLDQYMASLEGKTLSSNVRAPGQVQPLSRNEKTDIALLLAAAGYPRADIIMAYPISARELLLAAGFLIDKLDFFTLYRAKHRADDKSDQILKDSARCHTCLLPPHPQEIRRLADVISGALNASAALQQRVEAFAPAAGMLDASRDSNSFGDHALIVEQLCHAVLQLHGRWRSESLQIEELELHNLSLLRKLYDQIGGIGRWGRLDPPSQYELYVLERPGLYDEHVRQLSLATDALLSWRHEELFWEWMTSVLEAAERDGFSRQTSEDDGKLELSLLAEMGGGSDLPPRACPDVRNDMPSEALPLVALEVSEAFAHVEDSLASLRLALDHGLPVDDEWHELRTKFDLAEKDAHARSEAAIEDECGSGQQRFLSFLRKHWDTHKASVGIEGQQCLRSNLRALGLSFDEAMPAPWKCTSAWEDSGELAKLFQHVAAQPQGVPRENMLQSDPRGQTKLAGMQRYVESVKASYTRAVNNRSAARQRTELELENAFRLAHACSIHVGNCNGKKKRD